MPLNFSEQLYAETGGTMTMLIGAMLLAVLVLGTAALSGHPLYLIAVALVVGIAILAATRRSAGQRHAARRRR
jgi:hypothetical protein